MLYDGILTSTFDDIKDKATVYTDRARKVATLMPDEANGISGFVTAFFDLISGNLLTINERVEVYGVDDMVEVELKVEEFNESQDNYVASANLSDDGNYMDVNVVTRAFHRMICEAM